MELALRHVYALATSDGVKHELLLAPDTSDIPSSADTKQLRDALTAARLALRTSVIAIAASQPAQMSRLQRMPVVRAATSPASPYPVLPVASLRPATDCDCECENHCGVNADVADGVGQLHSREHGGTGQRTHARGASPRLLLMRCAAALCVV